MSVGGGIAGRKHPAALVISKLLVPETDEPVTKSSLKIAIADKDANVIDAAAAGAGQGMQLALNVAAMLLAFVALTYMINAVLGLIPGLSLEVIFAWALSPLAWLMGVPMADAGVVGSLIGVKIVLTEFIAYLQLAATLGDPTTTLSPRSVLILTYALLGFANIPSIAIQIGGIGGIAPERRGDLSRLGLKAMIGGNLAAFMSASLAGMLV